MRRRTLIIMVALLPFSTAPAAPPTPVPGMDGVRAAGDVAVDQGVLTVKGAAATLVIGTADADSYRLTAEIKPADRATRISLSLMPTDLTDAASSRRFIRSAPRPGRTRLYQ